MTCKDCLHYEACEHIGGFIFKLASEREEAEVFCSCFSDRSEWLHLPNKPLPLLKDGNPCNTDVYCPYCGENMSGHYPESPLDIIACFNCGELIDLTKALTREEAEAAMKGANSGNGTEE